MIGYKCPILRPSNQHAGKRQMGARYVVKDELTLGYLQPGTARGAMGVLASKIGGHDPKNGPVFFAATDLRDATAADFENFRVVLPPDFAQ